MVASTRVQILSDKAEEIAVLREFINNPNLGIELESEVKKLNSLTAQEEDRLQQAKLLMQRLDSLAEEVKSQEDYLAKEMEKGIASIKSQKEEFESWLQGERNKISEANKVLDDRQSAAEKEDTRLRQKESRLKETSAKIKGLIEG